jgi:tetratricopeptide (TPR) repeat protein
VQQASVFKQMGLSKRFRQESDAAMALDPQHIASRRGSIGYYVNAPSIAGGDTKKAEALVEEVAKIDRAAGYLARAQFLNESKAGGDVEALYQQAVATARTPEIKYEAIVALVNVYVNPNAPKYAAAEPQGKALLAIDPHRISGYSTLAIVYANLNRLTDLDATLADAEKAVPDNFGPYFQAGRSLLMANTEFPRAERYLRKYLTTTEPEPNTPTLAQAQRNLGLVLEKEGRKADAIAALEQAIKLKPDFEDAKKDLKRLR